MNLTTIIIFLVAAIVIYFLWRPKKRKVSSFPEAWNDLLEANVSFYRHLSAEDKQKFKSMMMHFLAGVKVTGVKTNVEDIDRVLIAACSYSNLWI